MYVASSGLGLELIKANYKTNSYSRGGERNYFLSRELQGGRGYRKEELLPFLLSTTRILCINMSSLLNLDI